MAKTFQTPPCEIRWANIVRPNYRWATAQDARGTFSIQCLLDPSKADHKAFLSSLESEWESAYADTLAREGKKQIKTHSKPWQEDTDEEGNPTGLIALRPKNKESFIWRDDEEVKVEVDIFDATLQRVQVEPGNGSVCVVGFQVNPFYTAGKFGLQLRLRAVQILDLVEYGNRYGFESHESGYRGEPYTPGAPEPVANKLATEAAPNVHEHRKVLVEQGAEPALKFPPEDDLPF